MTSRTKAIVAVDIFGYPCELDELRAIAERHGLALIDDSCEALGAEYKGKQLGSHGVPAVFAFYPNKQMTTGEGGMVTTHSEEEWRTVRSLRNQGRGDSGGWLEHVRLGLQLPPLRREAAIGIGQLEKLDEILDAARCRRRAVRRAPSRRRRRAASVRRRRRSQAVVVRLRRRASGRKRTRSCDRCVRARADRLQPVSAVDPPAAVHARAVRLRGRAVPGVRGR